MKMYDSNNKRLNIVDTYGYLDIQPSMVTATQLSRILYSFLENEKYLCD